jgi:putative ABC transport system ATP-binding protein
MIHLQRVSRTYRDGERDIRALREVSLDIAEGATVALVGRSGSGKSTLLHLIGGLEWPSAGTVRVAGQDLAEMDDTALTRFRLQRIGFVFQFFHLLPALTVRENLLLPMELAGRSGAAARSRCESLLEEVGLAERASSLPERLSGGEQQRIAVARALMLEPSLLLADEPTGNLDTDTGRVVLDLLWRMTRARGTTLLVATHSAELAARAGRRLELRDGRITEDIAQASEGGIPTAEAAPPPCHP